MASDFKIFLLCCLTSCISLAQNNSKNTLTICWDTSYSMKERQLDKDLSLLDSLITMQHVEYVRLLSFANDVQEENYTISNGNWSALKQTLSNSTYDGSSNYQGLNQVTKSGKSIVFTDGNKVFTDDFLSLDKGDILVNSSAKADYKTLHLWEFLNRATLIDLTKNSLNEKNFDKTPSIKGSVYVDGKPATNVLIHSSSGQSFISDGAGRFQYEGSIGDTLRIKGTQNNHNDLIVNDYENEINFFLDSKTVALDEVTVSADALEESDMVSMGYASIERKKVGFAVYDITEEDISSIETTLTDVLQEVPGLIMGQPATSGSKSGGLSTAKIRGKTSINYDAYALVVIDGTPIQRTTNSMSQIGFPGSSNADYNFIDPQNIKSIQVLRGLAATNLYGSEGRGGVILITSKTGSRNEAVEKPIDQARLTNNIFEGKLTKKKGDLNTTYLQELKKSKKLKDAYEVYLEQRKNYLNDFWYFIDISDYFRTANKQLASKVLSNILEIPFGYEAHRTLYLKYSETGRYDMALMTVKKIVKEYPNRIQAYFDMAIAQKNLGNYQASAVLLNGIVTGTLDSKLNFSSLIEVAGTELRNLANKHKDELDFSKLDTNYLNNITYNARLRFDWASPQNEFILKFVNPQNRFFDWEHSSISDKKRIKEEIQSGFGMEQFEIVGEMAKGEWGIYINNITSNNKESPYWVKCIVDYNFGKPNQYSEEKLIRLDPLDDKEQLFFELRVN